VKTPAIIYAAKSTQDVHGSIPTQLEDCRALAAREGFDVADEFSDEAFSAYKGNRGPGLAAAQRRAEELAPCALIVQHTDRLSRGDGIQAQHLGEIFFWATRNRVTLRSCQDDLLADPRMGPLMAAVSGMRNHEDSARKSLATAAGKKRRVQRGRPNGRTPYGYRVEGKLDEARLVVDDAQAAIVRRIFESLVAGESQLSIARALNREGIASQRGGKWAQGTLWSLVRKPVYIGKVTYQGEVFDGEHEPIVDAELFEKVQRILDSNVSKRGRRSIGTHLFRRGMLRCGHCGSAMIPRSTRRKDGSLYTTYQCIGRRNEGPEFCSQPDVRRDLVDGAALGYFETVGLDVAATRAAFEQSVAGKRTEVKALADQADRERLQKLDALQRVEDDYLAGKISGDSWERLQAKLQGELEALAAQSDLLRTQEEDVSSIEAELDAEAAMLERLSEIRQAVIGTVRSADGLDAVRAAIGSLFESFTIVKPSGPLSAQQVLQRVARGDDRGRAV
jgi:site-specific DNA recombinase